MRMRYEEKTANRQKSRPTARRHRWTARAGLPAGQHPRPAEVVCAACLVDASNGLIASGDLHSGDRLLRKHAASAAPEAAKKGRMMQYRAGDAGDAGAPFAFQPPPVPVHLPVRPD